MLNNGVALWVDIFEKFDYYKDFIEFIFVQIDSS